ncbi:MAG: bifunctional glutamate N-acetyltransferase/amino-acid acetyltransferase ArgJ, partial [Candidatus Omnitrophica bacterium]|nr:bifunctional glutamate N-acetyltransferase/amino-acid acetyltransferase ArgJ [Candidatus Omnitrophota bacterium]
MGIKLPKGFLANGIHCGLKKKRKDLSLFYSEKKCKCAALFTTNVVKAAPLILSEQVLKANDKNIRAIIVNSGNANCMTGKRGIRDAAKMVKSAALALSIPEDSVVVSSTGVIGKPMNMEPVVSGMTELVRGLSPNGLIPAAEGILTTDRFYKISTRVFPAGDKKVTMVGVAKGAGMIEPNMATMLCYIMTDAAISARALKKALQLANKDSFNSITVDGDMSTNDTVMVLANGEAGNQTINGAGKNYKAFQRNLEEVMLDLAKMIVRDGEGASKLVQVSIRGAKTALDARKAARSIADSLLTKCAISGGDPNWGRVASSVGSSGIKFDPDKIDVILDGVVFFSRGRAACPAAGKLKKVFKGKNVSIEVYLHRGDAEAVMYTCDISKKYITINSF